MPVADYPDKLSAAFGLVEYEEGRLRRVLANIEAARERRKAFGESNARRRKVEGDIEDKGGPPGA